MNTHRDILEELHVSRKVISAGQEVTPRFLVYTPTGNYVLMMPLREAEQERLESFRLARLFMVWQAATGFVLSSETKNPKAVTATFVSREEVTGARQLITREPLKFEEPVWYGREQLGDEAFGLLPPKTVELSRADLATIRDFEVGRVPDLTWFKSRDDDE